MTRINSAAPSITANPAARINTESSKKYTTIPSAIAPREKICSSPPPNVIANQNAIAAHTIQNRMSSSAVTKRSGKRPRTILMQS